MATPPSFGPSGSWFPGYKGPFVTGPGTYQGVPISALGDWWTTPRPLSSSQPSTSAGPESVSPGMGGSSPRTPKTSMPYTSFYQQQQQNFKNPYDVLTQGAGASSLTTPTTGSTGSLPGQTSAPDLTSITDLVNSLNRQGQTAANEARVPGNGAVEQTLLGNTAQLAQGQLPQDVINQIQQQAAERGVSTGNSDYLRSLGLTSLQAQQAAQGNLTAADARNPVAPLFNPATMLLTPAQQAQIQYQQGLLGLDWYRALTGQGGGVGGGRSAAPTTAVPGTDQANANWWNNLMAGTPSSSTVTPPVSGYGTPTSTTTSIPGASYTYTPQDFTNLFGSPYDTTSVYDTSTPPNTITTDTSSTYDPFAQYGDYLSSGG